ncbi:MAG: mechanosensitive ion channel [Propionibacteriales bacterium]|nr:mechanosensitive ion channel [Propionibacteriales bacterium]
MQDLTGSDWLAAASEWLIRRPLSVLILIVVAILLRWIVHRIINRLSRGAANGSLPGVLQRNKDPEEAHAAAVTLERRKQRADTMGSLLKSIATGIIFAVAGIMAVDILGYNIAPLLASAGILGLALGFGAQALVRDFLSGIFMILEDQYGVGDFVDVGEAVGQIEAVGMRVTRLRDLDGTVWYVRNGEILRVGNMSQNWARTVLDIGVAYGADLSRVREVLREEADQLWNDDTYGSLILEEPEIWGVERLDPDSVVVRMVLKTAPQEQWKIARELRGRIKERFDREGIEIPLPQRVIWHRDEARSDREEARPE